MALTASRISGTVEGTRMVVILLSQVLESTSENTSLDTVLRRYTTHHRPSVKDIRHQIFRRCHHHFFSDLRITGDVSVLYHCEC